MSNDRDGRTTSGETIEIPIDDWERVREELHAFVGETGTINDAGDRIACEFDNARFATCAAGTIEAGMTLHSFEGVVTVLRFDHERGEITALGSEAGTDRTGESSGGDGDRRLRYTFRRP